MCVNLWALKIRQSGRRINKKAVGLKKKTKYSTAEMSVRIQLVIPAKAGIQAVLLDSGCHRNDASGLWSLYCADVYKAYKRLSWMWRWIE